MTGAQLIALFPDEQPICSDEIGQALHALSDDCAERSLELVEVASGFRLQVRREIHPWITRLWTERQPRYGREVLETLSLIAYRRPITRGELEQIRGGAGIPKVTNTMEKREQQRAV